MSFTTRHRIVGQIALGGLGWIAELSVCDRQLDMEPVNFTKLDLTLDGLALTGALTSWMTLLWVPLAMLAASIFTDSLALAVAAVVCAPMGLLGLWLSRGIASRKRVRMAACGAIALLFAASYVFMAFAAHQTLPVAQTVTFAFGFLSFGLVLVVSSCRRWPIEGVR
jgi:hypothetical protein